MRKTRLLLFFAVPTLIFAGLFTQIRPKAKGVIEPLANEFAIKGSVAKLRSTAERNGGYVRIIIELTTPILPEGELNRLKQEEQQSLIARDQSVFLKRIENAGVRNAESFVYIPYIVLETSVAGLEAIGSDPAVFGIEEDIIGEPALAQTNTIVGASAAWASGFSGSGQTVAILDTGVEKTHEFLAGKVVSEACYSTSGASSTSFCPGGVSASTEAGSGVNCSVNGCPHGTNVAGIAAGRGQSFSGVAKDANIIAIQVFSQFTSEATCGVGQAPCARYWTSDVIKGLERVKTLKNGGMNIAAANLSLQTSEQYTSNCDVNHSATKAAVDNLRSLGVATIVCSGNYGYTNAMTAPACISSAVSVGSVDDGSVGTTLDVVSTFSDSSSLLNLLAPGRWINSSVPGNGYQNFAGTSMAAPHVAGAYAVLRQKAPNASVTQILEALSSTGTPISDSRNGVIKPRINVDQALQIVGVKAKGYDYDGDGKADISVFRESNQNWYVRGTASGFIVQQFGAIGDKIFPADYDGDGKTDFAVFRPSNSTWYIQGTQTGFGVRQFGEAGDIPAAADFDMDGRADIAIFRPSNSTWYILGTASGFYAKQFGAAGDIALPADYDGDSRTDIAVFRPSNSTWYIQGTAVGYTVRQFGAVGDVAVPADYDGDSKTDLAVYRPSTGEWYRMQSSNNAFLVTSWGEAADVPAPADYDGDGKTDFAVFRASNAMWYLWGTNSGMSSTAFGIGSDIPIPGRNGL